MATQLSLSPHMEQISSVLQRELGDRCRVDISEGPLSADDLRGYAAQQSPVCALAFHGLKNVQLAGRDKLAIVVNTIATVVCQQTPESAFFVAADLAAMLTMCLVRAADWGRPDLFRATEPSEISADNLFSGALDGNQGISLWGVEWTQTCFLYRS